MMKIRARRDSKMSRNVKQQETNLQVFDGYQVKACFPAGTPILAEIGCRPIETLCVGDRVWSYDERSGYTQLQAIIATKEKMVSVTVVLQLADDGIETTVDHLFYTQDGWKAAGTLTQGDWLMDELGSWYEIRSTSYLYERKTVFDIEVEGCRTYFAGDGGWLVRSSTTRDDPCPGFV